MAQELKNTQCYNATRIEQCPDHTTVSQEIYLIYTFHFFCLFLLTQLIVGVTPKLFFKNLYSSLMDTKAFSNFLNKIGPGSEFSWYPSFEKILELRIHWYCVLQKCYT